MKKPNLIHIIVLTICAFFTFTNLVNAQNKDDGSYGSANGDIQITGVLNNTLVVAVWTCLQKRETKLSYAAKV